MPANNYIHVNEAIRTKCAFNISFLFHIIPLFNYIIMYLANILYGLIFFSSTKLDSNDYGINVHGVSEGQTRLSDFTFTFHFHALEKEMATHSSVLAWRIPGTGEPGRLPSMGSHRVGHN